MMRGLFGIVLVTTGLAMATTASAETHEDRIAKILSGTIQSCWALPAPPEGQKAAPFSVIFKLAPDGAVDGRPTAGKEAASEYERMTIESGVRAVLRCSPYKSLSTSSIPYKDWKEITIHFDPSQVGF